jgi:hypothetical protein
MAPVAMQCFWSMRSVEAVLDGEPDPLLAQRGGDDQVWRTIVDTCHVWASDGPMVAAQEAGTPQPVPVFMRARLAKLGIEVPERR